MKAVRRICRLLEETYGRPECSPKHGPLDELVLTILSQNTSAANYTKAFANLRAAFPSWEDVREAPVAEIESAIRVGGLAQIKAGRVKRVLGEIKCRQGELSLDFLVDMSDEDARQYLMQFDGVGIKTASCVLMFSLCRPVLPVDTHIHRIAGRLGLIEPSVTAEAAHHVLHEMVRPEDVYSFHVNMVTHGRRVCRARNPVCDACCLLPKCPHGRNLLSFGET